MIARTVHLEQRVFDLVFDRDAIVRAALRAYIETYLARADPLERLSPVSTEALWMGDLQRGAFYNDDGCGDYEVVAWTEAGVVGLAYELGFGPVEQLGLSVDAVTGGPDDVRGAVPGLPAELETAFVMAVGMLAVGPEHGEKWAGVGFWLHGDRVEGSLFEDSTASGGRRLAAWGLLRDGRLPLLCGPSTAVEVVEPTETRAAPIEAIVDAVTARALAGPTELTADEIATLLPSPPQPARLLSAQRGLREVGIAWPGLPELPGERRPTGRDSFHPPPTTVWRMHARYGNLSFDRGSLVRAALHAYVENVLAKLDPLERHRFPVCDEPKWTGDVRRGAFYNGVACGDYDVVAWTESGVVGLTYKLGFGPIEQLGLSASAVTGGPDDVRAALPELPADLEPALAMATGLLRVGPLGERLASMGFWLHGKAVAGTFFDMPAAPGVLRLLRWGSIGTGTLRALPDPKNAPVAGNFALWTYGLIVDVVDAVVERALAGPTELTAGELATLLPSPPNAERLRGAQRMLRKVGITWPGSPEIPEEPAAEP